MTTITTVQDDRKPRLQMTQNPATPEANSQALSIQMARYRADGQFGPTKRLLSLAIRYRNRACTTRKKGLNPLKDRRARDRARELLQGAREWHRLWTTWRTEVGLPPLKDRGDDPEQPTRSRDGAVVRAAKQYGYAMETANGRADAVAALLQAAENLSPDMHRNRRHITP